MSAMTEAPKPTPDQELQLALSETPDDAWADCVWETMHMHLPELDEGAIEDLWITRESGKRALAVEQLIEATASVFTLSKVQAIRICRRTWGA